MSNSSSSSSRRSVSGVPRRCWCGRNLRTYVSQTAENPFRRFYRCEIALQRKNEAHLFKWIDEALLDETRMVDAKIMRLVDEMKELRKEMMMANASTEKMAKMSMGRVGIIVLVVGAIGWICGKVL